ncbi:hypothetical protein IFM89_025602 [Coptis chinensis]|uniref:GTD-binding domain-containing protein n=1 Tax=Coptis chinensis TaxID=261450 RepID=A0A835M431_9MAGN|nr:hypothetical protein IFM89_025602 [Coptis chinensis]
MAENEIELLKETLQTQQVLLQKLYIELEAEREASATAANEALSMIRRLQGEKAEEKLEASQYKRMAEEKINYAEEIMVVFEEVMNQKEMEITSLEFQVQAYRYKLMSVGIIDDLDIGEGKFLRQNEGLGIVRRNKSLPSIGFEDLIPINGYPCRERPVIMMARMSQMEINEDQDYDFEVCSKEARKTPDESVVRDLSSYWEQIRELDERVKDFSLGKVIEGRVEPDRDSSSQGLMSTGLDYTEDLRAGSQSSLCEGISNNSNRGVTESKLDGRHTISILSSQAKDSKSLLLLDSSNNHCSQTGNIGSALQSMSIQDIFEVPQNSENGKLCRFEKQEGKKLVWEEEKRLAKPDPIPAHGNVKYGCRDEAGFRKNSLQCEDDEKKRTKPREMDSGNCHSGLADITTTIFQFHNDVQLLNKRLEKLEGETSIVKQGVSGCEEEELKLLKEIHEQLSTIKSQIRSTEIKDCPSAEEASLFSIMETRPLISICNYDLQSSTLEPATKRTSKELKMQNLENWSLEGHNAKIETMPLNNSRWKTEQDSRYQQKNIS